MANNKNGATKAMITEAEQERLVLLAEECAEVIQAVTKILRHGWESSYEDGTTNLEQLRTEIDDVFSVVWAMRLEGEIPAGFNHPEEVWERKKKWMYFQ